MAIQAADGNGVITGSFKIPAGIKAGTKTVKFIGDGKGNPTQASHAETTFTGQGTVVTNVMRQVNNVMQSYYDPLAQTFLLNSPRQIHGVKLWVTVKGTTQIIVQLRETSVGFPTRTIVAEGRVDPSAISTTDWTTVVFDKPFYASANIEYAVVVLCNDAVTEVAITELGKKDISTANGGYVTTQPYQVGVLLSSANASTWTAHQDKDLTFQLLGRNYTNADGTKKPPVSIKLGVIKLEADTTDLLISALTTTPATGADADLLLSGYTTDPNSPNWTRTVSDGQVVKFTQPVSGNVLVTANLRNNGWASATIAPGTQIIAGKLSASGTYLTRDIPADSTATSKLTVTFEGVTDTTNDPKVTVEYCTSDGAGTLGAYTAVTATPQTSKLANGRTEYILATAAGAIPATAAIKLKITLEGKAEDRPRLFNLRVSLV